MEIRQLTVEDVGLIADIDRSEHIDTEYTVVDGEIVTRPVSMVEVPTFHANGDGFFSVASQIAFCTPVVERGGALLGAFEGETVMGLAVVEPAFEPPLAWLAWLHVSRPYRRTGTGSALWERAVEVSKAAGAEAIYVSAAPTGSAVGFYLSKGCVPADPVHRGLFEDEPDDVHLVFPIH